MTNKAKPGADAAPIAPPAPGAIMGLPGKIYLAEALARIGAELKNWPRHSLETENIALRAEDVQVVAEAVEAIEDEGFLTEPQRKAIAASVAEATSRGGSHALAPYDLVVTILSAFKTRAEQAAAA